MKERAQESQKAEEVESKHGEQVKEMQREMDSLSSTSQQQQQHNESLSAEIADLRRRDVKVQVLFRLKNTTPE